MKQYQELDKAISKAYQRENFKPLNVIGHGLACTNCNTRDCKGIGSGKYKCMTCLEQFFFSDWYRKVNGINRPA